MLENSKMTHTPQPEYLDIVDDTDQVIGSALYEDVYKNMSQHRIVHILIFNKHNELLLQMRSIQKRAHAQHWSTSVGGHVRSGETYEQAAIREAEEELGVRPTITERWKDAYTNALEHKKFLTTFEAFDDGMSFSINPEEVEKVEWKSLPDIKAMIDAGEPFHPELLFLLKKHFNL